MFSDAIMRDSEKPGQKGKIRKKWGTGAWSRYDCGDLYRSVEFRNHGSYGSAERMPVAVADRVYRSGGGKKRLADQPTHTIHYGYIVDQGETVDEVLVMLMRGPKSFTAEDTVEVNCHGGVYAMKRVLDVVLKNGARRQSRGNLRNAPF